MHDSTPSSSLFLRAFTAVAILSPILLIVVAGTMPEGYGMRANLVVDGLVGIVLALAASLVLRGLYVTRARNGRKVVGQQTDSSFEY